MNGKTKPTIKVKNVGTYLKAISDRQNNHAIIYPSGELVYLVNGLRIPRSEFESNNPLPVLQRNEIDKGNRLDSRSNWID